MRPGRKRELVAETCDEWNVSIRRACRVLEFDTSTYNYKTRRRDQAGITARIKDICATRERYGYRRVHVMLTREGWDINTKRTYRIYSHLGLQLRNKTPKRRVKAKLRKAGRKPTARTTSGRWTSSTISSRRARRSVWCGAAINVRAQRQSGVLPHIWCRSPSALHRRLLHGSGGCR